VLGVRFSHTLAFVMTLVMLRLGVLTRRQRRQRIGQIILLFRHARLSTRDWVAQVAVLRDLCHRRRPTIPHPKR
jgi:hypothetical protein